MVHKNKDDLPFLILGDLELHSFFFYKNIFYKNIEAEICEILRIFQEYFKNKAEAERILKRIDIILCVETSVNTMQLYVFKLTM